ncbi:MAG: transglycosylase SLT domain-containing protein [Pseudomonadota bacterium]
MFEALDERQYDAARTFASSVEEPLARTIATWALLRSEAPGNSIEAYDRFLDEHPTWPSRSRLQRRAEAMMDDDTPTDDLLAFYDTREPLSGFAKLQLGRALVSLGRGEIGTEYIRRAWTEHNFNKADSRDIVRRYGRYLSKDDHFAKADTALFRRTTAGTEDVLGLLTKTREKEVEVRRNLLRGRNTGRAGFNRLSGASQKDPGVMLTMIRYLRRQEREEEAIAMAALAPLAPDSLRDPEAWYYERRLLARWALKNGRFEDAYRLVAYSGLTDGGRFAEAEFFAGWVALRFLSDPERAFAHFDFMTSKVSSPISLARGNYWMARALTELGDETRARLHFLVAADYPYTYYGQLAIETLGAEAPVFAFPETPLPTDKDRQALAQRELVRALYILDYINQETTFRRFALALDDQITTEGEVRAYAELVRDAGHFDLVVRGGKATRAQGAAVPEVIYPIYPVPASAAAFVEAPLILGLSRQESEFRIDAYSSARAKGVMQLLDSTARITARKEGLLFNASRLLHDPAYNMTLGAAHLSHLLERFGGSYVMVLAAYNAGPHRVDEWVETYGDPRDPDVDPVDWVELIPFSETRNYVMRVMENVQVYRARLAGLPLGLQLTEDLTRGSPSSLAAIGQPQPLPMLFSAADRLGPPLSGAEEPLTPPLAVLWSQDTRQPTQFRPLLAPSGPPASVSNR